MKAHYALYCLLFFFLLAPFANAQEAASPILIKPCDGNLCQTIAAAKLSGIDFKLHIAGFGIREETTGLQCAADAGGGQYFDASDAEKLSAALQEATQTTIDATVNVIDKALRKSMAGSRTYTSPSSTPRTYHLTPGLYEVKVRALGAIAGMKIPLISKLSRRPR